MDRDPAKVALAEEARARLGEAPAPAEAPLVSIVVVSHNGADHLRVLLTGLSECTEYPRLELIVVDNGSEDDSLDLLRTAAAPFPIAIAANPHNESFSDANNQGAALARGGLLLFLNNDVEPFEPGWLWELVACLQRGGAGAVGATLVFPHEDRGRFPHGFAVQHRGLGFRDEGGALGPALHEWEADPLDGRLGFDAETPAVVAACLLVETALFEQVGGFTHGYLYGCEDIDLCLKLREAGGRVACSGRSLLIHRPGSTRRTIEFEQARERKLRNHRLLLQHWGPRLRREHDLDALAGGGMWVQSGREDGVAAATPVEAEALGICAKAGDSPAAESGGDRLDALCKAAAADGRRCLALRGGEVNDRRGLEYDVAIHVHGATRYLPSPGQLNVLWTAGPDEMPDEVEAHAYDLVLGGGADAVLGAALEAAEANQRPRRIGGGGAERRARDSAPA